MRVSEWNHLHLFNMKPLERAIALASIAHAGQVDKQDKPYILHCLRVMLRGKDDDEKIVGVLHDIIEDTEVTLDDVREYGFSDICVEAVDAMTHRKGQSLTDYYAQVKANSLALRVKSHDIGDNYERIFSIPDEMLRQRLSAKYERALLVLYGTKGSDNE